MRQSADGPPRLSWGMVVAYAFVFVAVPILTFYIGRFLDRTFSLPPFPPFPVNLAAGFAVFIFGLAIGIKATRVLYLEGRGLPWGEVKRQTQSTRLVTTNLYACCRNPMTFGYSLLPCGMGILFRSLAMAVLIPAVIFSAMIIWLRLWEEPRLERRFGQAYRDYERRTPFLVPRFKPLMRDLVSPLLPGLRRQDAGGVRAARSDHSSTRHRAGCPMEDGPRQKGTKENDHLLTPESFNEKKIRIFQRRLLRWYTQHGRDLPWRHTRDPYRILVSEVMLHQTQVDRVIPKYHEWLAAYPTFEALAAAPLGEIEKLWRPLGYNYRPERLQQIAKYVVNELDGELPSTFETLIALPGIGPYTAGAILSFAFHQDAAIVDTNIRRLIQRLFGVHGNPDGAAVRRRIWHLAETLIPHGKAFIFNQALIDFGALICTARRPLCPNCFANDLCMRRHTELGEDGMHTRCVNSERS